MRLRVPEMRAQLKTDGISGAQEEGGGPSPVETHMRWIREVNGVDFAQSMPGFHSGVYEVEGKRILNPRHFELDLFGGSSNPTDCEIITGHMSRNLVNPALGPEARSPFWSVIWHQKLIEESILSQCSQPIRALIVLGPAGIGKSRFLLDIFYGKGCAPWKADLSSVFRNSQFNEELSDGVLAFADDFAVDTNPGLKRGLANTVKHATASDALFIHPKGRKPITVPRIQGVLIICNDDPQSLYFLPEMSPNFSDKVTVVRMLPWDLSDIGVEGKSAIADYVRESERAMLNFKCWLRDGVTIPGSYPLVADDRWTISNFQDEWGVDAMFKTTAAHKLWTYINVSCQSKGDASWALDDIRDTAIPHTWGETALANRAYENMEQIAHRHPLLVQREKTTDEIRYWLVGSQFTGLEDQLPELSKIVAMQQHAKR